MKDANEISPPPLLASHVRLRDHVAFWVDGAGQEAQAVLVDAHRERTFRMQVWQGWVLQQLDGTQTVGEVLAQHASDALQSPETLEWLDTMVRWLCANGMAERKALGEGLTKRPKPSNPTGARRWGLLAGFACLVAAAVALSHPRPSTWLLGHFISEPKVAIPAQEPPLPPLPPAEIHTPVSGTLTEFLVKPGDRVIRGAAIARIVDLPAVGGLNRLRDEIQRSRDRRDAFFRAGDDDNYQSEVKHLAELAHELGEREFAAAPALVQSPHNGVIHSLALNLQGRGLLPGQTIGTIIPEAGIAKSSVALTIPD